MITWVGQLKDAASVAALVISICAALTSWRQYRLVKQRDREQHAAKTAIWQEEGEIRYANTSGLPIWSVVVHFDDRSEPAERGCWPPTSEPIEASALLGTDANTLLHDAIIDATERRTQARKNGEHVDTWTALRFSSKPRSITFTDGSGRRWRRDLVGDLTEIRPRRRPNFDK